MTIFSDKREKKWPGKKKRFDLWFISPLTMRASIDVGCCSHQWRRFSHGLDEWRTQFLFGTGHCWDQGSSQSLGQTNNGIQWVTDSEWQLRKCLEASTLCITVSGSEQQTCLLKNKRWCDPTLIWCQSNTCFCFKLICPPCLTLCSLFCFLFFSQGSNNFLSSLAWSRKWLQANFLWLMFIGQTERKSQGKDRNRPSAHYLARNRKLKTNGSNYHNKSVFISLDKIFLIFPKKHNVCGCLYSAYTC